MTEEGGVETKKLEESTARKRPKRLTRALKGAYRYTDGVAQEVSPLFWFFLALEGRTPWSMRPYLFFRVMLSVQKEFPILYDPGISVQFIRSRVLIILIVVKAQTQWGTELTREFWWYVSFHSCCKPAVMSLDVFYRFIRKVQFGQRMCLFMTHNIKCPGFTRPQALYLRRTENFGGKIQQSSRKYWTVWPKKKRSLGMGQTKFWNGKSMWYV